MSAEKANKKRENDRSRGQGRHDGEKSFRADEARGQRWSGCGKVKNRMRLRGHELLWRRFRLGSCLKCAIIRPDGLIFNKRFQGLNPDKVFKHRLNIADLTKAEHDMYLMGVIMASVQNLEETCRHKERIRIRSCYAYQVNISHLEPLFLQQKLLREKYPFCTKTLRQAHEYVNTDTELIIITDYTCNPSDTLLSTSSLQFNCSFFFFF